MASLHVLNLWEDYIEMNPQYIESAYREVLGDVLEKVKKCFDWDHPVLQIPFVVKNKTKINHYLQYVILNKGLIHSQ